MKILLLEDDVALNQSIYDALIYSGYDVRRFYDGKNVLTLSAFDFDLYIMDINVQNVSGLELLRLIQNQSSNSKVIIISSNTDIYTIKNAYNFGCIDYLKKPFHLEELRIKIDMFLAHINSQLEEIRLKPNTTLSKKEKNFLLLLVKNKNQTTTYQMIDETIYQGKTMTLDGLRALVRRIRGKLEIDTIKNVLDEGYTIIS